MICAGLLLLWLMLIPALFKRSALFTLLLWSACVCLAIGFGRELYSSTPYVCQLQLAAIPVVIQLQVDSLAAFFGFIFALGFPLGMLYGHFYLKAHPGPGTGSHLFWLGLMMISMFLVLLLRHSLMFLLAWELMSLASFFAILYSRDSLQTRQNALYYFVMMHLGAAVLLCGFALLYFQTGSFSFGNLAFGGGVKWLLIIGFAFKAGFFPFYSWLPKAHPVAPSHLSGMMSGLMIKTGIFGIIMVLFHSQWQAFELYILVAISLITAFNGVLHALTESNLKRALAYSSIENIGLIGIGLCFWQLGILFGNPLMSALGLAGALLHIMFHSLFKSLLFYLSGNIMLATHSLNIDALGGLHKRLKSTSMLFLLGSLAISALPMFSGFISEFSILGAILLGFNANSLASTLCSVVAGAVFAFVSALVLIAFTKLYSIVFSGEARTEAAAQAKELPFGLLLSPAILALLSLILGLFGNLGLAFALPLIRDLGIDTGLLSSFISLLQSISIVLVMLLLVFAVLYLLKNRLVKRSQHSTWACGYFGSSPKMQYTGPAYINPLAYFLKPLLHSPKSHQEVRGYFPQELSYQEELIDYLDKGLIAALCRWVKWFYSMFSGIQNGKTNSYITYLLLALLALLFWVLGVPR